MLDALPRAAYSVAYRVAYRWCDGLARLEYGVDLNRGTHGKRFQDCAYEMVTFRLLHFQHCRLSTHGADQRSAECETSNDTKCERKYQIHDGPCGG